MSKTSKTDVKECSRPPKIMTDIQKECPNPKINVRFRMSCSENIHQNTKISEEGGKEIGFISYICIFPFTLLQIENYFFSS